MQKSLRINLLARNQAIKHSVKSERKKDYQAWQEYKESIRRRQKTLNNYTREEREHRREDWLAGPLAPMRDAGKDMKTYGGSEVQTTQIPEIPVSARRGPKRPAHQEFMDAPEVGEDGSVLANRSRGGRKDHFFRGDTIVGNVVAGDRVVVVEGPERLQGTIAQVMDVDNNNETVMLINTNVVDIIIPPTTPMPQNGTNPPVQSNEVPIPMSWVRLVHPLTSSTGGLKDTIIRHVHAGPPYVLQRYGSNLPSHTRYITGSESFSPDGKPLVLEWPEERSDKEAPRRTDPDTFSQALERVTYVPTITSPLGYLQGWNENTPQGRWERKTSMKIMDELRDKTYKGNSRHDDSTWVQSKILEDARAIWWRDRQLVSPTTAKAKAEVQARQALRAQQAETSQKAKVSVVLPDEKKVEAGKALDETVELEHETAELVRQMQQKAKISFESVQDRKGKKSVIRKDLIEKRKKQRALA